MMRQSTPRYAIALFSLCLGCGGAAGAGGNAEAPVQCMQSDQCPSGWYCSLGMCVQGTAPEPPGDGDSGPPPCACTGLQQCDAELGVCAEPTVCLIDGDCLSPRVCIRGTCDVAPECRSSEDCAAGSACDEQFLACQPYACTSSDECLGDRKCDTEQGFCVACIADDDCPGAQECRYGECGEPATCASNEDCLGSRVCSGAQTCEPASCSNDAYEENDTLQTAAPISVGDITTELCLYEEDYFSISAAAGDGVVVRASYEGRAEAFSFELYDTNGELLTHDDGQDSYALLAAESLPTAGAIVRVWSENGGSGEVALTFVTYPGGACFNDPMEPNDTIDTAHALRKDLPSQRLETLLCSNDRDVFSFELQPGATFSATLIADVAQSNHSPVAELSSLAPQTLLLRDGSAGSEKKLEITNDSAVAQSYALTLYAPVGAQAPIATTVYTSIALP